MSGDRLTCTDRAELGRVALQALGDRTGDYGPDNLDRDAVVDTLANLRHYCRVEGIDFEAAALMASIHFDTEEDEEGAET